MKNDKMKTKIEVFICNHQRESGKDCFHKGSKDLTDELKSWAKENHGNELKVYRSGCLSKCDEGIALVTYPQKEFFLEVTKEDTEEIKKGLQETLKKINR